MQFFALTIAMLGLVAYGRSILHFRAAPLAPTEISDIRVSGLFFLYLGISLIGLRYPPVEHGGSLMRGTAPAALWAGFTLAALQFVWLVAFLKNRVYKAPLALPACLFPIVAICNIGILLGLNGALDFAATQRHSTKILAKQFSPGGGRSQAQFLLAVNDWALPGTSLILSVDRRTYELASVGHELDAYTGPGLFGIEWTRNLRPL